MFALWYMLIEHGTKLEADFQRFYHLDLADLYRGTLGARKAAVLAAYLPPEAAVMRAEGGNGSLTVVEHQLRGVLHVLEMQMYQNAGGKGKKPQEPKTPQTHLERRRAEQRLQAKAERSRRLVRSRKPAEIAD